MLNVFMITQHAIIYFLVTGHILSEIDKSIQSIIESINLVDYYYQQEPSAGKAPLIYTSTKGGGKDV